MPFCENLSFKIFGFSRLPPHRESAMPRVMWHPAIVIIASLSMMIACAAVARDGGLSAKTKWFNIPSEPLATALQAYSEMAGVQVLYESDLAVGRRSVAVQGHLAPDSALHILLSSTNLKVFYTRTNAITLTLPTQSDGPQKESFGPVDLSLEPLRVRAQKEPEDNDHLRAYSAVLRADIQRALIKDSRTRSGTYRAGLQIWIDASRTIQKTQLVQSTGNKDRDAAIIGVLNGLVVSETVPSNTPQPVRVGVVVRTLLQ